MKNTTKFLDNLNFPEDLKEFIAMILKYYHRKLEIVFLDIGAVCGGHLGSNLGVVELTVVLHTIFDSPKR